MSTGLASLTGHSFIYTPCYCEENSYFVAKSLVQELHVPISDIYLVFISNVDKQVALWHHRASHHPSGLVVWDYHVVVMVKSSSTSKCTVYDLDIADSSGEASLGVPCDMTTYAAAVLSPSNLFPPRKYRIIPAENFFKHFASDRSHMIKPADPQATTAIGTATGQYRAPPPPYPPIVAPDGNTHTLDYYLDMSSSLIDEGDFPHSIKNIWSGKYGVVMKERVFLEWAILH